MALGNSLCHTAKRFAMQEDSPMQDNWSQKEPRNNQPQTEDWSWKSQEGGLPVPRPCWL